MQSDSFWRPDSTLSNEEPSPNPVAILDLLLARSFNSLFCLYLFLVIVLPSGSVFGVNFKLPLYALLLPSALYVFCRQEPVKMREVAFLLMAPAIFLIWVIEAQVYGFEIAGSLRQYTDILLTLLTCWLAVLFCRTSRGARVQFLRTVIAAETLASSLKVVLLVYALLRGVPVTSLIEAIDHAFGVELMTMDLGALLGRIQFVSDGLIPICVFAILYHRQRLRIGAWTSLIALTFLLFSVVLSFSRYFWAYTLLALVMGLTLGKKDRVYAVLLAVLVAVTLLSLPLLSALYQTRFSQEVAGDSDTARVEQIAALKLFFLDAPLLGHGLGSYTSQVIRSEDNSKFGYEVQLLALFGQVGLAGMLVFAGICAFYFRCLWPKERSELLNKGALVLLLLAWLASGLFNPLLINPVGAVSYAVIMCMGCLDPLPAMTFHHSAGTRFLNFRRRRQLGEFTQ